ncbi:MAG: tetratricopeptide repeat protein [Planctomycetes bacterium]|nr:tetratricopeptide repeat protein [Planctomycetota bacterium]
MRLTSRGKRRLVIVSVVVVVLMAILTSLWMFRSVYRLRLADQACATGLEAYARGDYEAALADLSYGLSHNQDNIEALLAFADTRSRISEVNNRHLRSAINLYKKVLEHDNDNFQALDAQLQLYIRLGFWLELGSVADRILALDEDHIEALRAKATIAYRDNSFEEVANLAERLSSIQPQDLRWRALKILALQAQDEDIDSILDLCDKWIEESAVDGRFYLLKAQTLKDYGRIDEARTESEQAASLGTGSRQILSVMMSLLDILEIGDLSEDLLATTKTKYPNQSWVYEAAVRWHWQAMRLDYASAELSESENVLGNISADLLKWKALIHAAKGEFEQANISLDKLVALTNDDDAQTRDSTRGWVEAIKARLSVSEQNWLDGIVAYQKALALEPNSAILEFLLAEAYQHIGEHDLALIGFRRAARIDPHWISIPIAQAKSLIKLEQFAEAVGLLQRVIQRAPGSGLSIYHLLGQAWLQTDEAVEASISSNDENRSASTMQQLFKSLYAQFPNDPDVIHILAEIHARYGFAENAVSIIQRAIDDEATKPRTYILLTKLSFRWRLGYEDLLLTTAKQQTDLSIAHAGEISLLLSHNGQSKEAQEFFNRVVAKSTQKQRADSQITILRVHLLLVTSDQDAHDKMIQLLANAPKSLAAAEFVLGQSQAWNYARLIQSAIEILVSQVGEHSPRAMLAKATYIYHFQKDDPAEIARATKYVRDVLQGTRDSKHALTLMAALLLVGDDPKLTRAIDHIKRAINLYPSDTSLYPRLISLLQQIGDNDEASEYLKRLASRPRLDPQTRLAEIKLLQAQGDLETAIDRISQFTDESLDESVMIDLATMYAQIGKQEDADAIFQQLLGNSNRSEIAVLIAADFYVERGRYQYALQLIKTLAANRSNGEEHMLLGAFHQKHGNFDEAYKLYLKAVETAPKNAQAWNSLASFLLATGQAEEAKKAAVAGLEIEPSNESIQATLAIAILGSKDSTPQQALELVNNLGSGNQPLKDSFNLLLRVMNDNGEIEPTQRDLNLSQQLVKEHSQFMPAWQLAVMLHVQSGQVDEALRLANQASRKLPGRHEPAQWAAILLRDSNRLNEALLAAQTWRQRTRVRRIEPDAFVASVQLDLGHPTLAVDQLIPHADRIWNERLKTPQRVLLLLRVYLAVGDSTRAGSLINMMADESKIWWDQLLLFVKVLDAQYGYEVLGLMQPVFLKTRTDYLRLAKAWSDYAGRIKDLSLYDRAEDLAQAAEAKGARTSNIELLRGIIAAGRGDLSSAEQHYRKVLSIDREHLIALNNLAYALISLGERYDEALILTQRAIKISPNNSEVLDTHARALLGVGRLSEAEQAINSALESFRNSPTFRLTLARILIAQEKYERAENELNRVKRILQRADLSSIDLQIEHQQLIEQLPSPSTSAQR